MDSRSRLISWNINGIRTHEKELYHLKEVIRPDVVVLTETRADAYHTMRHIWPGSKVFQVLPQGRPARVGTAVIFKPGAAALPKQKINSHTDTKKTW